MSPNNDVLLLEHNEDTLKGRYPIFSMGSELYGIEIRIITEILKLPANP